MRKFAFILAALIVAGVVESVEAANRLQVVRSTVPKIVEAATKTAGKIGGDVSNFFWRNKASIVTGTVLVTAATNPEPFIEGAVAATQGPPTVIVQNGNPSGEYTIIPYEKKRVRSVDWRGYGFLGGLLGILALVAFWKFCGRVKAIPKVATVVLLVGILLCCCGIVRADVFAETVAMVNVPPWGWKALWDVFTNILMIVLLLLVPTC